MDQINVVEKEIAKYYMVKSFEINIVGLDLNQSVSLIVRLYDSNQCFLFDQAFQIEGTEYLDWAADDQYIISLVAQKLGLKLEVPSI